MASEPQAGRRGLPGFTLVEMLVVLLIMATFVTLVAPSVAQALRSNDIDATSERLREMLQFAYAAALARRQPVMVNVDHSRRRAWATVRKPALPWLDSQGKPSTTTLATMSWPEATRLGILRSAAPNAASGAASFETVTFRSDGRTDDLVVELSGERNEKRFIEVVGRTGEARMRGAKE